jgi:hypothetical protein
MKAYINHITKVEFFTAYQQSITVQNAQAGFRRAGLVPFDPEAVISKLDVKLRTPTPTGPPSAETDPWASQTPHNPTEALSQTTLVKDRIALYQGSSPTPIFATVAALAKGTEILAHQNTLLAAEVHTLRKANEALSKLRRAKKNRIRQGGALTIEDAHDILALMRRFNVIGAPEGLAKTRGNRLHDPKTGHNGRTCQEVVEISSSSDSE